MTTSTDTTGPDDTDDTDDTDGLELPQQLLTLLGQRATCYLATTMPDGSPQLTQLWVTTDGRHVVLNTVQGYQKLRNIERDPRVALTVSDPANPSAYWALRGRVTSSTTDGGADHIEALSQRYTGGPYPWYGGHDQVRVILTIAADSLHSMGG